MDFCIQQLRELVKWECATDEALRTLLKLGTSYPYSERYSDIRDTFNFWAEYLTNYKKTSNGDIELAIMQAEEDLQKRRLAFNQWCIDHKDEVEKIFANIKSSRT